MRYWPTEEGGLREEDCKPIRNVEHYGLSQWFNVEFYFSERDAIVGKLQSCRLTPPKRTAADDGELCESDELVAGRPVLRPRRRRPEPVRLDALTYRRTLTGLTVSRWGERPYHKSRVWRNWQTRMVEGHVGEIPWRFESSHPHKPLADNALRLAARRAFTARRKGAVDELPAPELRRPAIRVDLSLGLQLHV